MTTADTKNFDKKMEKLSKKLEGYTCSGQMSLDDPEILRSMGFSEDEEEIEER